MVALAVALDGLPRVPITEFKSNPARYRHSGALVTNHGHVECAYVPVVDSETVDEDASLRAEVVRQQLHLLLAIRDPASAAQERAELAAERDADRLGDPL